MMEKPLYPMMVRLEGRRCVVFGGGAVAERKIGSLLECGASVTVVSPSFTDTIEQWIAGGDVKALRGEYEAAQLQGAALVFAATDKEEVNRRIAEQADALGIWANAASGAEAGSFQVPAAFRRGRLTIAVSTGGASPAAARLIRRKLERQFDERYAGYLDALHEFRERVMATVDDERTRLKLLRLIAEAEPDQLWFGRTFDEWNRCGIEKMVETMLREEGGMVLGKNKNYGANEQ